MLCSLPVLLAASAFFSGSETALFFLSSHQRLELRRSGGLAGSIVWRLLAETRALLITLLLGNMSVNVLYFVITTLLLLRLKNQGGAGTAAMGVVSVAVLLILILIGEVTPKLLATRVAVTWSKLVAVPLMLVHRAVGPLRWVLNLFVITPLARLIAPRHKPAGLSSPVLEALLRISAAQGVIDRGEEQLLQQVLELGQLRVRDVMTPRVDVEAFDLANDPADLIALIRRTHLSRIPIYESDVDHIVGVARARQVLLRRPTTRAELTALIQPARFVPEQQRADRLLLTFRQTGTTFALVVDEYGGTAGLVTLEDVVEQMVGQIAGPRGVPDAPRVESVGPGRWRVGAELSVRHWSEAFGQGQPSADVSTIGGLVMARLGRLPAVNDSTRIGNVDIRVVQMQAQRIAWLELHLAGEEAAGAGIAPAADGGRSEGSKE